HTRFSRDWSSDVCSSDLGALLELDVDVCVVHVEIALDDLDDLALKLRQFFRRDVTPIANQHQLQPVARCVRARCVGPPPQSIPEIGRASCRESAKISGVT